MSLGDVFNTATGAAPTGAEREKQKPKRRRPAPFSLRLSTEERTRLEAEAAGAPLGAYIRARLLKGDSLRGRIAGKTIVDRQALAQVLAQLGRSRLSSNLNQLAHAVNIGSLPITPETEADLHGALRDVRAMRGLLLTALGLKGEDAP